MNATPGPCRKTDCENTIPLTLAPQQLCLDHFLDEVFARTNNALERTREKRPIDPAGVEQMLADALTIVENLDNGTIEAKPEQRDRMLELLLILANLHEYVASQPARVIRPA